METVEFIFKNIQSHANTRFSLKEGLNFILADDNNVGKSTIFKAIQTMVKMPYANNSDLQELLRVGELEGYVLMKQNGETCIFHIFREGDRVRAFFESFVGNEESVRTMSMPNTVLNALDIIVGNDREPINFNDADSIQLVVQDTSKNDEVLSKVLIDVQVERIKENIGLLGRQTANDYKIYKARYDDSVSLLDRLSYNDAYDAYICEQLMLSAAGSILDMLDDRCNFETADKDFSFLEDKELITADRIASILEPLVLAADSKEFTVSDYSTLEVVSRVLQLLYAVDLSIRANFIADRVIVNAQRAIATLDALNKAVTGFEYMDRYQGKLEQYERDRIAIEESLVQQCKVVDCPMRGEVYFSEEKCIPCGD